MFLAVRWYPPTFLAAKVLHFCRRWGNHPGSLHLCSRPRTLPALTYVRAFLSIRSETHFHSALHRETQDQAREKEKGERKQQSEVPSCGINDTYYLLRPFFLRNRHQTLRDRNLCISVMPSAGLRGADPTAQDCRAKKRMATIRAKRQKKYAMYSTSRTLVSWPKEAAKPADFFTFLCRGWVLYSTRNKEASVAHVTTTWNESCA